MSVRGVSFWAAIGAFVWFSLSVESETFAIPTRVTIRPGDSAYVYLPTSFSPIRPTPILMVLYGVTQYPDMVLKIWQPVADRNGYILVCPVGSMGTGYTRSPVDDRGRFMAWAEHMGRTYSVDWEHSAIVGFSRGGSYAIETGIFKSGPIKTFVSLFGFFRADILNQGPAVPTDHRFILVTSLGDETEAAMKQAATFFRSKGVAHELRYLPGIYHDYPRDMDGFLRSLRTPRSSGVVATEYMGGN